MANRSSVFISVVTRTIVTLVILAIGVVVSVVIIEAKPAVAKRENPEPIKQVYVMEAARVAVGRSWDGFGTAAARDEADIASELTGMVVRIEGDLRAGSRVEAGQAIVVLDDSDVKDRETISRKTIVRMRAQIRALDVTKKSAQEQLGLAEDELAAVKADYERALASFDQGGASQSEIDGKRRAYKGAARVVAELKKQLDLIDPQRVELEASVSEEEARLALILHDLARCVIRSPLTGILQSLDVNVGESVAPGKRVARVVRLNRIEIPLRFAASARSSIHVGDEVTLTNVGAVASCWTAEVARIAPDTDPQTRTFIVYGELTQSEDDDPLLVPGLFVRATFQGEDRERRLIVPRRSILDDTIWVIDGDGNAERRGVGVLYHVVGNFPQFHLGDTQWSVLDDDTDLKDGEAVILTNIQELIPGMKVHGTDVAAEVVSPNGEGSDHPSGGVGTNSTTSG